jgi:hypothetical protein
MEPGWGSGIPYKLRSLEFEFLEKPGLKYMLVGSAVVPHSTYIASFIWISARVYYSKVWEFVLRYKV